MGILALLLTVILLFVISIFIVGVYLLSKLVGGFENLQRLFYKFTGWGKPKARTANGGSSRFSSSTYSSTSDATGRTQSGGTSKGGGTANGEKMFGRNEGTYVDFEEVK